MKLAKYSKYKDKVYNTIASSSETSSSSSSPTSDRTLWGNDDVGNDMDGSMRIQGNIYVMGPTTTEDENGDIIPTTRGGEASSRAGDTFPPVTDDGEGNLYLDGKVYSEGMEARGDIVAGGHIYIASTHPDHKGQMKCVGELINGLDARVTANTTDITELFNLVCPIGTIVAFNGQKTIPDNWAVCDGTNGTPDLSGKFIKGVKSKDEVGKTGGASSVTLSSAVLPRHSHTFSYANAKWFVMSDTVDIKDFVVDKGGSSNYCLYTGSDGGKNYSTLGSFSGTTDETGTNDTSGQSIDTEPPYYTLIYIMRVK